MIYKKVNWPDWWTDYHYRQFFLGCYKCFIGHFDICCLDVGLIYRRYGEKLSEIDDKENENNRRAAMWYAAMKTAIETFGLKG